MALHLSRLRTTVWTGDARDTSRRGLDLAAEDIGEPGEVCGGEADFLRPRKGRGES
jgi:hypothetical protein